MVTSPSRTLVMQLTGLSDATVKRWTCWMVRHGVMAQLEVGRLARFRPMAVQDEGGRVSVYVLCTPGVTVAAEPAAAVVEVLVDDVPAANGATHPASPVDKSDPSVCLGFLRRGNPYPGARERSGRRGARVSSRGRAQRQAGVATVCRRRLPARRLDLVERLQVEAPALRPASARRLRNVLLPWLERPELGWTVAELLYAIDHTPDGRAHTLTAAVKVPHKMAGAPDAGLARRARRARRAVAGAGGSGRGRAGGRAGYGRAGPGRAARPGAADRRPPRPARSPFPAFPAGGGATNPTARPA